MTKFFDIFNFIDKKAKLEPIIQSRSKAYSFLMLFVFNIFHICLDLFSRRFWRPGDHDIALRGPHYV